MGRLRSRSKQGLSGLQTQTILATAVAFATQNSPPDCFAPDIGVGVVLKGYEDGLAALWTDDSVLLSVSDVGYILRYILRWKHP